jgi:hypothetical protein
LEFSDIRVSDVQCDGPAPALGLSRVLERTPFHSADLARKRSAAALTHAPSAFALLSSAVLCSALVSAPQQLADCLHVIVLCCAVLCVCLLCCGVRTTTQAVDYIGDVFFWLDLGLNFVTPYFDDGFLITDDKRIAQHYLKGYFTIDLLSTIPLDSVDFVVWRHALLRLPRLLRLVKYETYFKIWEQSAEGEKAHILRFVKLLMALLIIIHWLGCVYIALGYLLGFSTDWLPEPEVKEMSMGSQYLYGMFWSTNILLGVGGEPERPTNDVERVITLMVALVAIFVVAIIIGNVSELVQELNVNEEKFRQKAKHTHIPHTAHAHPPHRTLPSRPLCCAPSGSPTDCACAVPFRVVLLVPCCAGAVLCCHARVCLSVQLDEINLFMRNRRLPDELQTRIRNYYTNIWSRKGGLDDSTILCTDLHTRRAHSGTRASPS